MKALVTGAGGFLGRHVVTALLGRGAEVRAMVRPAAAVESLGWPDSVEVVRADLRSSRDLERAFDGVDVLVHLAAAVSGGEDAQFAATVVGTERLLQAMAGTSCRRVVLASSFSVYDWSLKARKAKPISKPPSSTTPMVNGSVISARPATSMKIVSPPFARAGPLARLRAAASVWSPICWTVRGSSAATSSPGEW